MSEEIKNQQAAEPEALTETEINEQMQVRINKMHQIEELDTGKSLFFSHHNPEMVEWFMSFV